MQAATESAGKEKCLNNEIIFNSMMFWAFFLCRRLSEKFNNW
jgi:hypothetical protein